MFNDSLYVYSPEPALIVYTYINWYINDEPFHYLL